MLFTFLLYRNFLIIVFHSSMVLLWGKKRKKVSRSVTLVMFTSIWLLNGRLSSCHCVVTSVPGVPVPVTNVNILLPALHSGSPACSSFLVFLSQSVMPCCVPSWITCRLGVRQLVVETLMSHFFFLGIFFLWFTYICNFLFVLFCPSRICFCLVWILQVYFSFPYTSLGWKWHKFLPSQNSSLCSA